MAGLAARGPAGDIRPRRVGDTIRAELAGLLQRAVRDPAARHVAVTRVKMSRDLEVARVYYTILPGGDDLRQTQRALRRARPFLRRQLGRIGLRRVPELAFLHDDAVEEQDRVARLLDDIAGAEPVETDAPPDPDA